MELAAVREAERLIVAACAPLLLWIGYRLFQQGVTGNISVTLSHAQEFRANVANLAPGAFCFFIAIVLGTYVLGAKVDVHSARQESANSHITAPPNANPPRATHTATRADSIATQSSIVVQHASSSYFSYGGLIGSPTIALPSASMRRFLSDEVLALASPDSTTRARTERELALRLTHIPSPSEMSAIEVVERRWRYKHAAVDSAALANWVRSTWR
jgi:hypothetical protein